MLFQCNAWDAAQKLASDFGIDCLNPGQGHPTKSRIFPYGADRAVIVFSRYLRLLNGWRRTYAPTSENEAWHPLFAEAMRRSDHIAYLLEEFRLGNKETRAALARAYREEVEHLERRLSEMDGASAKAG